jgi:HD-GYP domain-containing protein (c-di-GMP phosphodiesterase class II)
MTGTGGKTRRQLVSDLPEILKRLEGQVSLPQRMTMILEWALARFPADGIGLFVTERDPAIGLVTRVALGTLATTAPLIAAELSRTGIPSTQGVLPLASTARNGTFLCCPLNLDRGAPWSALILHGEDIEVTIHTREEDLQVTVTHLRDSLEIERRTTVAPAQPLSGLLAKLLPDLSVLTDGLDLPLYVCDSQGRFTYASPACLELTGYTSLEEVAQCRELFPEPGKRAAELETVRTLGKIASFPLVLTSGSGARLHLRDSAVAVGEFIIGVFFDITGLLRSNADLKDALQVQELLNDSIIAGTKNLERTQGAAIRSLARLAEYRDPETGFHLQRICEYTRLIATQVHLRDPYSFRISQEYANDISLSSMLHDIGKVSIPDHILLKPGKLDPLEWETMKKHTLFGWEVLHKADRELGEQSFLTLAATIALSHHEHYDGKGYPNGTAGERIPLSARISAIADVYDALTSVRPYKEAWSHERTAEEIVGQAGRQFDPVLAEIFHGLQDQFADVRRRFPG